jgi:hypothetical protein
MEENQQREKEMLLRKNEEMQAEKMRRNFKRVGKMAMRRIYAPPVKKVEVQKKSYTQEEEDFINYGLKTLIDAKQAA